MERGGDAEWREELERWRRQWREGADRTGEEGCRRAEVERGLERLKRDQNRTKGGMQGQRHT